MAFEPFKFLHAASLRLDRPLFGVGAVPDDVRWIVEDASFVALERLTTAAIEQQVEFVLLTGECFDNSQDTLRAELSLIDALETLDEHGIHVYISEEAGGSSLLEGMVEDLPGNVTVLKPGDAPVACLRDGRVIASLRSLDVSHIISLNAQRETEGAGRASTAAGAASVERQLKSKRIRPYQLLLETELSDWDIDRFEPGLAVDDLKGERATADSRERTGASGTRTPRANGRRHGAEGWDSPALPVLPVSADYLALAPHGARRTFAYRQADGSPAVAHFPGEMQGVDSHACGPRGATLVSVERDGSVEYSLVQTAPVTWEAVASRLTAEYDRERLLEETAAELQRRRRPETQVCLLEWTLIGGGPLMEQLLWDAEQRQLVAALERRASDKGCRVAAARVRLLPGMPEEAELPEDRMISEFLQRLHRGPQVSRDVLTRALSEVADLSPHATSRLVKLLPHLDRSVIVAHAQRTGLKRLRATSDLMDHSHRPTP